ncbi:TetR family transcriptional regulator [Georgenia soli]|uniref:TetR family transcriptional regulator n=1 Tax=Georgenia soli TaxID=638953 RepID=A0A2A9EKQ4_9MICO|nr:TetR/AcrR family transcriptional regulator [Georgenia soli]PFG39534.1 TetR family transcriptional regulator [Georgenia soli]
MTQQLTETAAEHTTPEQPARRGPGRPRHTDVEPRSYEAVLELFGQHGWSGLTLDAVATHAGIGKSSIYLRWKTKRELLLDAVRDFENRHVSPADEGQPLREYLVEYAVARGRLLLGVHGPTMLNIVSAAMANPDDFQEIREESISQGILPVVGRIERAVAEGELPEDVDGGQLLDMIEGALVFHLLISPRGASREELGADLARYAASLVDNALQAAGARSS